MIAKKPHLIFFLTIPALIIVGYISNQRNIDFNIYDAYYVIGNFNFAILISIVFFLLGIGYWLMDKLGLKPSKRLIWIHLGLTFGGGFIALLLSQFYSEEPFKYDFNYKLTLMIYLIILLIAIGQGLFAINIFIGLLNKRKPSSDEQRS